MTLNRILVASTSPVKFDATRMAFDRIFKAGNVNEVTGKSVDHLLITEQPRSDAETFKCAHDRVQALLVSEPDFDYYVGIEGGIEDKRTFMLSFAWVYIAKLDADGEYKTGFARSGAVALPRKVADLVRGGMELGPADDLVFGMTDSKKSSGSIGILTNDLITRTDFYREAVLTAMIPFIRDDLEF